MSFQQTRFLGASIKSFTNSLGLGGQISTLIVDVVEDISTSTSKLVYFEYSPDLSSYTLYNSPITVNTADSFNPPVVGSPVHFQFGSDFIFDGILQSVDEMKGMDGHHFRVTIIDPRTLLEDVELILSGYNGPVSPVSNIFNIYGFLEDPNNTNLPGGFGYSLSNEGGIPFYRVQEALFWLLDSGVFSTLYGGPGIKMMGFTYKLDMTSLPIPPAFYRVGPGNTNLLSVIQQLCEDSGFDLYFSLYIDPNSNLLTIKANTISRIFQPQPGQIENYIAGLANVNADSIGNEFRNEVTSAFLVGGQQEYLWYNYAASGINESEKGIWPYWGLDGAGNAIIGQGDFNSNSHNFTIDTRFINIPTFPASYNVTIGELRAALQGFDLWSSYVTATKPAIANILSLTATFNTDRVLSLLGSGQTFNQFDLLNSNQQRTIMLGNRFEEGHSELYNAHILYDWIYKLADENYGRKFMVRIHDVNAKIEPNTGRLIFSDEPSDGGWNNEDIPPLGLPEIYEDLFQTDDGRTVPISFFTNNLLTVNGNTITSGNTSELSPNNTLIFDDKIYVDGVLDDYIVFTDAIALANPRVILNVNGRVLKNTTDAPAIDTLITFLEDSNDSKQTVKKSNNYINITTNDNGTTSTTITPSGADLLRYSVRGKGNGYIPELMTPLAVMPDKVVVPLRSNVLTYGPWYTVGPPGKVYFEQDNTLVPWNYGGLANLNYAGNAQIASKITNLQISERGSLTVPGAPATTIGLPLQFGMPIVNSIDVTIDEQQGVTTTYKMEVYTERFGVFSKQNFDRFSRIARNAQQFKRNFLQQQRNSAFLSGRNFNLPKKGKPSKQVATNTPHEALISYTDNTTKKTGIAFITADEGLGSLRSIEPSGYQSTSLASLDTLFQPFSCDVSGNHVLPHFLTPAINASSPTINDLNPYSGCNFQFLSHGNLLPNSFLPSDSSFDPTTARGPALRAPTILAGWGYDINGFPFPNAGSGTTKLNSFASGYKTNPASWFAGPLDTRIDTDRGVWVTTSPPDIAVIAAISGYFNNDPINFRPRYVVRPVTNIASGGALTYLDFITMPPMSGATDKFAFNLQENIGDKNTLGVGSPVMLYNKYGQTFFNELPRSFAHRTNY